MNTPASNWKEVLDRNMTAMEQIRAESEPFWQAIVTERDGLVLIRWDKSVLALRDYRCGRSYSATDMTARLLFIAGFGELDMLESYLKYGGLRATREPSGIVKITAIAVYVPPPTE